MGLPDTLLLLSGGIDSAYCMWKLLSEGKSLLVHHVHLKNHEGRVEHEARAVECILEWMRGQGLIRFAYTESSFDYGTLRFIVKDAYLWAFMIGVIMANPRNRHITKTVVPRHWDAFPTGPTGPGPARTDRVYREIPRQVCGRAPELIYPIVDMMKADVVRAMPPGLLECCWWCRTPTKDGEPCHTCYTCKLVDDALAGGGLVLEAEVINRFKDKYTGRIYNPGDVYRHPNRARMEELASLDPPRVQWPPKDDEEEAGEEWELEKEAREQPNLDELTYRELQEIAKASGIKANQSRGALVNALRPIPSGA